MSTANYRLFEGLVVHRYDTSTYNRRNKLLLIIHGTSHNSFRVYLISLSHATAIKQFVSRRTQIIIRSASERDYYIYWFRVTWIAITSEYRHFTTSAHNEVIEIRLSAVQVWLSSRNMPRTRLIAPLCDGNIYFSRLTQSWVWLV